MQTFKNDKLSRSDNKVLKCYSFTRCVLQSVTVTQFAQNILPV